MYLFGWVSERGGGRKMIETQLNKVKIVLCALWDNQPHPEAGEIVDEFKKEIDNIKKGD